MTTKAMHEMENTKIVLTCWM